MTMSPLNLSVQKIYDNQDVESPILKKVSQISAVGGRYELKVPRRGNSASDETVGENSSLVTGEIGGMEKIINDPKTKSDCIKTHSGTKRLMRTPNKEPELAVAEALSGVKKLLRTPKQKPEPVEALSGVKRLLKTPKQKPEPVEALSGVKRLLKTPKQKPEPVEALSGVKRLLKTPKQKPEPVEALSGVKRLLKTPKQKPEPVEALSGVKRLLKTPKQKPEPVEALSGVKRLLKTPKQKPEPVEALSGVKRLLRTPKQKPEPVDALSGVKRLLKNPKQDPKLVDVFSGVKNPLRTPKQDPEPVETLSGVKSLLRNSGQNPESVEAISAVKSPLRTPKQNPEPVKALSGVKSPFRTPKQDPEPVETLSGVKSLLRNSEQNPESVEAISGVKSPLRTPKQNPEPVEALSGVKSPLRNPDQKPESVEAISGVKNPLGAPKQSPVPVEVLSGVKRLLRTPKQNPEPVEFLSGVKRLLRTPKQNPELVNALSGVKKLFRTPKQNPEPVKALSGVKSPLRTPKQDPEPVKALSGVKSLLRNSEQNPESVEAISGVKSPGRNPDQKPESVEAISGVKIPLGTPKQSPVPVEVLSGVKRLLRTPKQNPELVNALSGVKKLLRTPKPEPVETLSGVKRLLRAPNHKAEPVKDGVCSKLLNSAGLFSLNNVTKDQKEVIGFVEGIEGIQSLLRTPKQKFEPVEDMIGISRILKTPKQKFMPVDDYLGLQKLMAEPKQNSLSAEIDYTGVKELLGPEDGYLVKLSEAVNKPHEISSDEFECKEDGPEREESWQETGLEDSFEKKSPNAMPRRPDDGHDYLGHTSCSSLSDVKGGHVESIATVQLVSEKYNSDGMDFQSGAVVDFFESSAQQGDPVKINAEIPEPLASVKKPRKEKAGESSFTEEHDTTKIPRKTRNTSRAKLANRMQTDENFDKVPETSQPKESESDLSALKNEITEELRKKSMEKDGNMAFNNIKHAQELLGLPKQMSVETQPSVNGRRVVDKLSRQAEESLHLEENATNQEYTNQFISKTSLRSRNQKNKDEPKSEFTKPNPQEKMQSLNLETSKRNSGNQQLKRNTRRRKATAVETEVEAVESEKHMLPKICELETLENHPTEMKDGAVKRRKVCFLLESGTSETLEEKCVFGGKGGTQQKQYNAFSERNTSPVKENTSQKNKKKAAPVVSPALCISFSSEKQALAEISKERGNFTLENKDPASFAQGECLQKINFDENLNETQVIAWENMQLSVEHSALKRQKVAVAKKNPPRRGRSRTTSPEPPTENGSKVIHKIEKQPMSVENANFSKENQPKRGRGRKIAPVSQTLGTLTAPEEDLSTDSSVFVQGECLQGTQNENKFHEVHKACLDNTQAVVEHILPKRQEVARGNLLHNSRSKQGVSHEPAMENDRKNPDVENQDMVAENAFTEKENQPKRGRRRKFASVTQTQENLTVPEEDTSTSRLSYAQEKGLQDIQNEGSSTETQKVVLDNTESSVEHILPKRQKMARGNLPQRGRRKQAVSDERPTVKDNKNTPDVINQDKVVEDTFTVKENQPKRGRGRKAAVPQILESDNFPLSSKNKNGAEEQAGALKMATTLSKNLKEDTSIGRFSFTQEKCLQDTQNEEHSNETQKVVLGNIESSVEHILPKRQKVARGNLPQRGRRKQVVFDERPTEKDNKDTPDVVNQDKVVEDTFTVKENQPKRGRGRKAAVPQILESDNFPLSSKNKSGTEEQAGALEMTTTLSKNVKEDTSIGRFSFAQEKCLQVTQNEEHSNETQKIVLGNIESSVEHILPKRQVSRRNLPQRGRRKQVVFDERPTEKDNKDTPDVINQDMVVENAFTVKENLPKRGRGRKVAAVPQVLENDHFPLSSKDKSGVEEQAEALEMTITANSSSHRGRCKKSSVPAGKKPSMVDNVNQKEMASELKDVTKENVSKKLPVHEASTETNIQQRATGSKLTHVKCKKVSADSLFENQSKRSRGKNIVLAFQTPTSPALKISITLPSSDKNETARENQNLYTENNATGKENLSVNGRRNKKIVPRSTSARRKCKLPEEKDECQDKPNVDMEKTGISNDKQKRTVRKVGASKTTFSEEKCGLPESSDGILKDQQVIMANTISEMEDASQGRRKRVLKGKNLLKHSDQNNSNQKNDLEITLPQGKENSSKRGRRDRVSTEAHRTISGMKQCPYAEKMTSAPEAENSGSTLQRGGRRKKMKEEHILATTESAIETQTKMKANRRTRKRVL
ncbi:proliferation marker protein Ki-67-like [Heteronotia binoei]|nr:proliferation marker protein Ki-67-like [Heteronotia binoei]